jgi:hypothetical protein
MPDTITIQDVERLVDKFKVERYTYLILIGICTVIIIIVAIISLIKGDWKTALSLFAPGGTIFFCLSKVFKIWDDIRNAFFNSKTNSNE